MDAHGQGSFVITHQLQGDDVWVVGLPASYTGAPWLKLKRFELSLKGQSNTDLFQMARMAYSSTSWTYSSAFALCMPSGEPTPWSKEDDYGVTSSQLWSPLSSTTTLWNDYANPFGQYYVKPGDPVLAVNYPDPMWFGPATPLAYYLSGADGTSELGYINLYVEMGTSPNG